MLAQYFVCCGLGTDSMETIAEGGFSTYTPALLDRLPCTDAAVCLPPQLAAVRTFLVKLQTVHTASANLSCFECGAIAWCSVVCLEGCK